MTKKIVKPAQFYVRCDYSRTFMGSKEYDILFKSPGDSGVRAALPQGEYPPRDMHRCTIPESYLRKLPGEERGLLRIEKIFGFETEKQQAHVWIPDTAGGVNMTLVPFSEIAVCLNGKLYDFNDIKAGFRFIK